MSPRTLSVLVVDDSAVVRQAATAILSQDPGIVVTVAADPYIALDKMGRSRPDVILLDLEMPRMDGLTFLRRIMAQDPIPVVVCSGLAARGTEAAMRALEEGAVEVIAKPQLGVRDFLHESAEALIDTLRGAAEARVRRRAPVTAPAPRHSADVVLPRRAAVAHPPADVVVAIGASTGGTEALRVVLEALPETAPGILIVQHMPERFTAAFADVTDGPAVNRHRPSVDVLFRSVAQAAGAHAIGVLLTGMGDDGAAGLLEMRHAGADTIAQDERTCVVFGMPKEAIARGAASEIVPLPGIAAAALRLAHAPRVMPPA